MSDISRDTKATLLLTARLLAAGEDDTRLLTPGEFNRLCARLASAGKGPGDLFDAADAEVDTDRLIDREPALDAALARWQSRDIRVVGRTDAGYPRRMLERLKDHAPALLYVCGSSRLLDSGGLAVVGSRDASPEAIEFTRSATELAAMADCTVVSGGARGIDQAAMRGALLHGGRVVGVLADSLERAAEAPEHRELTADGRLTLISPFDPAAGFNVGNAMQRNKMIYALADAALVVSSDFEKGGTWSGAAEQLKKFKFGPVYVREAASKGLDGLRALGAQLWPNPASAEDLQQALHASIPQGQRSLSF